MSPTDPPIPAPAHALGAIEEPVRPSAQPGGDGFAAASALGLLSVLTLLLGWRPNAALWQNLPAQIGWYLAAFVPFLTLLALVVAGRVRASLRVIAVIAAAGLIPRLACVFDAPALSDDAYRYIWDGHVANAGYDPYRYPPPAPELAALAAGYPDHARINHPTMATIYPPGAIAFYRLCAALGGMPALKLALIAAEGAAVLLLMLLLHGSRLNAALALTVWLSPMGTVEFASSAHVDALAVAMGLAGIVAFRLGWFSISGAAVAASILVKPYFILLVPFLGMPRRAAGTAAPGAPGVWKRAGRWWAGALLASAAIALPYLDGLGQLQANSAAFGGELKFFAGPFEWIHGIAQERALEALSDGERHRAWSLGLQSGVRIAGLSALILAAALWFRWVSRAPRDGYRSVLIYIYWIAGFALWWSSQVHPWYWLTVAVLGVAAGRVAWLAASPLAVLSYVVYVAYHANGVASGPWEESGLLRAVAFGGVALLVLLEELRLSRQALVA